MVLSRQQEDPALSQALQWALNRMAQSGYPISATVTVRVDPSLQIMGYARHEGKGHVIIVAAWALDSEMLGGLLLHELAHIYHTDKGSPSHEPRLVNEVLNSIVASEGLTPSETGCLTDAFNHLQNILVDDIVFEILRSEREIRQVQLFFSGWISDRPTGEPRLDATLLVRNAFAIASLKRRRLYHAVAEEMSARNKQFLSSYGGDGERTFAALEDFLEKTKSDWGAADFRRALEGYLGEVVALMRRDKKAWEDLR